MIFANTLALAGAFALSASAVPVPEAKCDFTVTPEQIVAIAPKSAQCNATTFQDECADATRAAPAITTSFKTYNIASRGAQAALIAIMVFESGSFQYSKNHFPAPGRPGQGTKNMQMIDFNREYATATVGAEKVAAAGSDGNKLIDLLIHDDNLNFGSAAWFLTTKCSAEVQIGLQSGSAEGWSAYLTECVGTEHTPDRDVAWEAAKKALNVGQ